VYLVLFGVFVLQATGVVLMRETSAREQARSRRCGCSSACPGGTRSAAQGGPGARRDLGARRTLRLGRPAVVRLVTGSSSPVLGGLALFVLARAAR